MAKFAGQFVEAFVRLSAAVRKEYFARRNPLRNRVGEAALRLVIIKIGNVDQLLRLLDQRLGNLAIGMAQGTNGNAATQVQKASAGNIPKVTAGTAHERQIESAVTRHDIFYE